MRIFRFFSLGVFTALVFIIGGALLLPSEYNVHQKIFIKEKPSTIFPFINNLKKWNSWAFIDDENNARLSPMYSGPEEGEGAIHTWMDYHGNNAKIQILASEPFEKVKLQMTTNDGAFISDIHFTIEGDQNGSVVVWDEKGDFGFQLSARVVAFMSDYETKIGEQYQQALEQLKNRVEETSTPKQ
ncbi:SRPBCC family protein [Flammeovirga yaeyamensis]|uniref:SRPBCC family protein n=1 Tax=Flammeovirga yaeyamensis TaxID=367791 RepID=A0AAX1N6Y1_9BACT|nr:SRPBCC family protein [Flammeovirga yaeyamensis]MBB3697911.1 hypothetical protein [Flammeovirga yaeyamensis]NMF35734.1 hypothetical protein [Flammeovirga yaeyamensis]QWG03313.1 SRPBCC family protein [Flammeovirga yaeyamensis]